MTMRRSKVPEFWARGEKAGCSNIRTDGESLWSYDLKIGYTDENGDKILLDYTKSGIYYSSTTSKHVGYARLVADEVRDPREE